MRVQSYTGYATLMALVGALACAGNPPSEDPDESAAARDTTTAQDTLAGQNETPPGYRGMEQDTTQAPTGQTPSDTFLQNQGQGTPQDTAGYTGMERPDTTGGVGGQTDTTGTGQTDTTGMGQTDTTTMGGDTTGVSGGQDTSGMTGADTTNQSTGTPADTAEVGDTTGYGQQQQSRDSTNR
jgi:hypothetical protein